jgi:hypothetical protein
MWDESDDDCIFSSRQVGRKEAEKTSEALKETERSLYDISAASTEAVTSPAGNSMDEYDNQNEVSEMIGENAEPDPYEEIRRFQQMYRRDFDQGSDGAAGSSLNEKEINEWKKTFPYLRVCGAGVLPYSSYVNNSLGGNNPPGISSETSERIREKINICNTENFAEDYFEYEEEQTGLYSTHGAESALEIRGTSITQKTLAATSASSSKENRSEYEGEGEILFSHGIMEEAVEVNFQSSIADRDPTTDSVDGGEILDPPASIQEQAISLHLQSLWPEVVVKLRVLVTNVLCEAHAKDVPYSQYSNCGSGHLGPEQWRDQSLQNVEDDSSKEARPVDSELQTISRSFGFFAGDDDEFS